MQWCVLKNEMRNCDIRKALRANAFRMARSDWRASSNAIIHRDQLRPVHFDAIFVEIRHHRRMAFPLIAKINVQLIDIAHASIIFSV